MRGRWRGRTSEEQFKRVAASYNGILKHCDSYGLRNKLNEIYFQHSRAQEPELPAEQEYEAVPPPGEENGGENMERKCYNCEHFYNVWGSGYCECRCKVHGSLGVDQHERHPDTAAATCGEFTPKREKGGALKCMYVDADTIIKAAAVLTAIIAIGTAVCAVIKWFQKQEKQTADIEALRKKQSDDMKEMQDELCLISYAMLACLDGLKQQGCNGAVTEAHNKLEKHLNQRAHDQK